MSAAGVIVSLRIKAGCEAVFRAFVEDLDLWWQRGPKFRFGGESRLHFFPGPDGRVVEETAAGPAFERGLVRVWEPPYRIVFEWKFVNFAPGETSELEVTFAPVGEETRVSIEHRGLERLRADHPARHGAADPAFQVRIGHWWREILEAFKGRIETPH